MRKLKVIELFSGIGSQTQALKNIGIEHEVVAISDIDKYSLKSYNAIHGETYNMGDISKINPKDVPDCDLITYSFPCFSGDTKVLTNKGYKNIKDIKAGDMVFTHKGRYKKVLNVFNQGVKETVNISSPYFDTITTTLNHPFYTKKDNKVDWTSVDNLESHYLSMIKDNNKNSYQNLSKGIKDYEYIEDLKYYWIDEYTTTLNHPLEVYDIEVEEDHSFTANNVVVHNCTDLSNAGKQKGMEKGSGTSSSLLWYCEDIFREKKPKYLLMENVKALVSKKFKDGFEEWIKVLEEMGYKNYWKVLNAKDFGVPQSRERVFMVSILGDTDFTFPKPKGEYKILADILEDKVEDKFYLKDKWVENLLRSSNYKIDLSKRVVGRVSNDINSIGQRDAVTNESGYIGTLMASDYKGPQKIVKLGNVANNAERFGGNPNDTRVYDKNGISPTLTHKKTIMLEEPKVMQVGNCATNINRFGGNPTDSKVYDKNRISPTIINQKRIVLEEPLTAGIRGRYSQEEGKLTQRMELRKERIVNTLTTVNKDNILIDGIKYYQDDNGLIFTIRYLTPKEYWRLMGFTDEQFEKAEKVNSNTQLYKQAGNSIVVNMLEEIFKEMFKGN